MTENDFVSPLAYCEIFIGPHKFACGIDKKDAGGYSVEINHQDYDIKASSDEEAIKVGMARIGEILFDRLSKFEGNPYALPVIEIEEE